MRGWTEITVTPDDTEIREAENMLLKALDKYLSTDGDDAVSVSEEARNFVGALLAKPPKKIYWANHLRLSGYLPRKSLITRFMSWARRILGR